MRRSILNETMDIIKNPLLLVVLTSISFILMFAKCMATMTKSFGMESWSFLAVIGGLIFFSINYLYKYFLDLNASKFALYSTFGIKQKTLLFILGLQIIVAGTIAFLIGSIIAATMYFYTERYFFHFGTTDINTILSDGIMAYCLYLFCSSLAILLSCYKLSSGTTKELHTVKNKVRKKIIGLKSSIFFFSISFLLLLLVLSTGLNKMGFVFQICLSLSMILVFLVIQSFYYLIFNIILLMKKNNRVQSNIKNIFLFNIFTKDIGKSTNISIALSSCMVISFLAYLFGALFLTNSLDFFEEYQQIFFSTIQLSIAVAIILFYLIILAMDIVGEISIFKNELKVLSQLGFKSGDIKSLFYRIIFVKLSLPSLAFWIIFIFSLILFTVSSFLPNEMNSSISFILIFFVLGYHILLAIYAAGIVSACKYVIKDNIQ